MPEQPPITHDVFISANADSQPDQAWIKGMLLPRLKRRQLRIKTADQIGVPKMIAIEQAIAVSRHTLLILSPDYFRSDWAVFEQLMLQSPDPTNQRLRLLPLIVRPCVLPARLGYLIAVDFTQEAQPWPRLFAALQPEQPTVVEPAEQADPVAVAPAAVAPVAASLNTAQFERFVVALSACATMQDREGCDIVIQQLPSQIRQRVPYHASVQMQVLDLVKTCQRYPDGLAALLATVRLLEGDSWAMRELDRTANELGLLS